MSLEEKWNRAIKETEVLRSRLCSLLTFKATPLPYVFLAESAVNIGDTVVRKGKISVDKPLLILPKNFPQFKGFEFEEELHTDEETIRSFLLIRGVTFPSMKYINQTHELHVYEGSLKKAIDHFSKHLEKQEDVYSGLIVGPEDCWQFSTLIYVATLIAKSASGDLKKLLDDFERKKGLS